MKGKLSPIPEQSQGVKLKAYARKHGPPGFNDFIDFESFPVTVSYFTEPCQGRVKNNRGSGRCMKSWIHHPEHLFLTLSI